MKSIVIADHHPITAKGINSIIKKDKEAYNVSNIINSKEELMDILNTSYPNLIILDIEIPGFEGLTELKNLKNQNPETRIIVFSQLPEALYALSAIREGASGYIPKNCSPKKFKKALDMVARGGIYLSNKVNNTINSSKKSAIRVVNKYRKLSSREAEVLDLIAKGHRNKDIAEKLEINEKTVSTYKTRLYKKLNVDNVAGLIQQSKMLVFSNS